MNFIIEFARICATFFIVGCFSILIHITLTLWQAYPIEEEKSTPIYIIKELYK